MSRVKISTIITVFLALVLLTSVFAIQEDFQASTTPSLAICTHGTTTNTITIRNTGDIESSYSLQGQGSALNFATYSENSFTLKSGETKAVQVFLSPNSNQGNYNLQTTIKSALGNQKVVNQVFSISNCANIQLSVKTPIVKSNPCEPSQFSFVVSNARDFAEMYDFAVQGLEQYVILSANSLLLAPGESKQVDVFVNPACDIYGEQALKFQAYARTSQFVAEANVKLDIARNYAYAVAVPSNTTICNLKQTKIPVSFANQVPFTNQYELTLNAPSWITQEANKVQLGPYGQGVTNLVASPVHPGTYVVDLTTTSVRGQITKAGSYNVIVDKCYDVDVNIDKPSDVIMAGHSAQYTITVSNLGTKQDTFKFEMEAPKWVSANAVQVTLNPKETKTFTINAVANVSGNYKATFRAISTETNVAYDDSIQLKVVSLEDAYKLSISPSHKRVLLGNDEVKINLENKGILPATYDLTYQGQSFAKLQTSSVTLEPGKSQAIVLATTTDKTIQLADYQSRIVATVKGEAIAFTNVFNIQLRQLTVGQEIQLFVMNYWPIIVAVVVVLLIALFIYIFGGRIARKWRNWRIAAKEAAKLKAELKAQKAEEKKAKKLLEQSLKLSQPPKSYGRIFGAFMLSLLAIVLIAGVFMLLAGYGPLMQEFVGGFQKAAPSKFDPIIKVNTTGLEAYGNTVLVRGSELVIPVIVKNNYDKELWFGVETNQNWIRTDVKEITLKSGEQEVVNLRVIPTNTTDGLYKITVSATLEQEDKVFKEDIKLNVKKSSWLRELLSYIWYFVGGIVALIIVMLFMPKKKGKKEEKENPFRKEMKPIRRINISIPGRK